MEIRNCPECGKIFKFIRTNLCPECQAKDEECFQVIRKYIIQHPGVSAIDVSKGTGISQEKVLRFLRQGRLSVGTTNHMNLECELCGGIVSGGRYCSTCQEKLTAGLKKYVQEENKKALEERRKKAGSRESQQGARMHTADLWQKKNK